MLRFRQMKSLQKFASVHANVHNHFNSERHLIDRQTYKVRRSAALVSGEVSWLEDWSAKGRLPIGDGLSLDWRRLWKRWLRPTVAKMGVGWRKLNV